MIAPAVRQTSERRSIGGRGVVFVPAQAAAIQRVPRATDERAVVELLDGPVGKSLYQDAQTRVQRFIFVVECKGRLLVRKFKLFTLFLLINIESLVQIFLQRLDHALLRDG